MKTTFSEKEIKDLIREVIQERWRDIFKSKPKISGIRKIPKYPLFTDIIKWVDTMTDDAGKYIGPELPHFPFDKKGNYVKNPDVLDHGTLLTVEKWNEQYGEEYNMDNEEIDRANRILYNDVYTNHPEVIIGSFPNQ